MRSRLFIIGMLAACHLAQAKELGLDVKVISEDEARDRGLLEDFPVTRAHELVEFKVRESFDLKGMGMHDYKSKPEYDQFRGYMGNRRRYK